MRKMYVDIRATVCITCEEGDTAQVIEAFEEKASTQLALTYVPNASIEVLEDVSTEITDSH